MLTETVIPDTYYSGRWLQVNATSYFYTSVVDHDYKIPRIVQRLCVLGCDRSDIETIYTESNPSYTTEVRSAMSPDFLLIKV